MRTSFRPPAPAARTRHAKPERAVERICDHVLAIAGWWVIRWKNTAVPIRGTNRWMFQGTKGVPDRLAVKERGAGAGEVVAVEYKAAGGAQSPDQVEFQRRWEAAGRRYVLARGPEDLARAWMLQNQSWPRVSVRKQFMGGRKGA